MVKQNVDYVSKLEILRVNRVLLVGDDLITRRYQLRSYLLPAGNYFVNMVLDEINPISLAQFCYSLCRKS